MLRDLPPITVYETEITPMEEEELLEGADAVTITRDDDASFHVDGAWAKALVGRVNFNDRESLMNFERTLIRSGIIERLREAGCKEGDLVYVDDMDFEFID